MPTEESKLESFDESVNTIAEKIHTERKKNNAAEHRESSTEQQREAELDIIRTELRESYGDTGGTVDSNDKREEDEEVDSVASLQPAGVDETETKDYLETVPEKYKEPITELLQTAVHGGIVQAVAKAGKENNPYVVDALHDSIAKFLHQRMQDQGLL